MDQNAPDPPAPIPTLQPDQPEPHKLSVWKRKRFKLLVITAVGVTVLALGVGAWKLTSSKKSPNSTANLEPGQNLHDSNSDVPETSDIKQYENGFLGLNLAYPATWTLTEPENKDAVRLESPEFKYQTSTGEQTTGNFRIYVRKGAREADSKYIGRGLAIKPSEKITYSQPVAGQRTETLLSSFGLDSADNFAFFLIAGNFQLNTGESLGPTYGKEAETYIIAGGYSSKDLVDDLATNPVPTDYYSQTNAYKQAVDIIKSLQLH